MVKEAENTICDIRALKSQRFEFSEISTQTVLISGKAVK